VLIRRTPIQPKPLPIIRYKYLSLYRPFFKNFYDTYLGPLVIGAVTEQVALVMLFRFFFEKS